MKASDPVLFTQATDITTHVEYVLGREPLETLASEDLYNLAERLERARNILLVLGDRKLRGV